MWLSSRVLVTCVLILAGFSCQTTAHAQSADSLAAARAAYAEGRYGTAIAYLGPYSAADASADALYLLGRSHQALLQHDAALDALQQARQLDSLSVRTLQALGQSYEALGRFASAESAYARALEITPSRTLHLRLAELYRKTHEWKEATYHYRVLLRSDSTNSLLHARIAQSLQAQNRPADALRHFQQAHRLNPRHAAVALPLSRLLEQQHQPTAALQVIDSTLHYRATAALWKRRANLAFRQDSLRAARRAYERAIQQGDSTASTFRRLGIAHVGSGQYASALDALEQARARDSTNARTHFYLGVAYRGVDSLQQSAHAFEHAVDRVAGDVLIDAYMQSAVTYDERGQLDRAIAAYKTALQIQPARVEIYFHLATLYDTYYRDKTTAALYYRKFLATADSLRTPFHTYASNRLRTLRPVLHFQRGRTN